jgi:hypothetical protein
MKRRVIIKNGLRRMFKLNLGRKNCWRDSTELVCGLTRLEYEKSKGINEIRFSSDAK